MRPLEGRIEAIDEVEGGPVPLLYIAYGHVDKREFVLEMLCEFDAVILPEHVMHTYVRNVPWHGPDGWVSVMYPAKMPGRGAYPITCIEQGWILRPKESDDASV